MPRKVSVDVQGQQRNVGQSFFRMTYSLMIDQKFAIDNGLSIVQLTTLAAFMTLPTWSKNIAIDGFVWYQYSEEKMAVDFPLLFGVPKRCYKNITELAELGFVQLTKLGRDKYVRFTARCSSWNRGIEQNGTNSPKTDFSGPKADQISPKTDFHPITNELTNDINKNKPADGGLFQSETGFEPMIVTRPRRTAEPASCLFENSRYAEYNAFAEQFTTQEFADVDLVYYYNAVADWSAQKGKKMKDWIATARNFIRSDMEKNKLHRKNNSGPGLSPDAIEYLNDMAQ